MSETDASPPVLERQGARATIRLNRPKHLNRLQADDLDVLLKLFAEIEDDPALRVLVLTGTGRAFSAGYDLNSVAERATSEREQKSAGSAFETVAIWRSRSRPVAGRLTFTPRWRGSFTTTNCSTWLPMSVT